MELQARDRRAEDRKVPGNIKASAVELAKSKTKKDKESVRQQAFERVQRAIDDERTGKPLCLTPEQLKGVYEEVRRIQKDIQAHQEAKKKA